jgi:PAS domain S-box-containing protein
MPHPTPVPSEIVRKWQEIVDLTAEIMHVPSALIMRVEPPNIKVFVSSETKGNPYEREEIASLNTGLYCETVMKTQQPLLVPDALRDEKWRSNPDIKLGMVSYLGVPIVWPDGEVFGTICVLDEKPNEYSELYRKLLLQWRDVLQADLRSLTTLHRELEERETKIRRLVDANIIGIFIWGFEGQVLEANDAFLHMLGYDREDLASGRLHRTDLTPSEWRARTERAVAEVKTTGTIQPFEKEYLRKDGSRVPVLLGATSFDETANQGVAFVLDLTERKRAETAIRESERRYRELHMELAHANRVATIGQLSASIAHEINQPIAAVIANASAGLRWLGARPPELEQVRQALARIVRDGKRAGEVIGRVRALVKKAPARGDRLDISEAIREVISLTEAEMQRNRIKLQTELADGLPLVPGDRVQVQQVIVNLIINAVEAMTGVADRSRELTIAAGKDDKSSVFVEVRDTGPGLDPEKFDLLFQSFHTTKPDGLGMGLAISRSIVEAHGGQLAAAPNEPRGAVFRFTLPVEGQSSEDRNHRAPDRH